MKTTRTLLSIYASGVPGGLSDLKKVNPPRRGGVGGLLKLLKPKAEDLKDEAFFNDSTIIMLGMIVRAMAQIANKDPIGRFTAGNIPDCVVVVAIKGADGKWAASAGLLIRNHRFTATFNPPEKYHTIMEFGDIQTARALFDGKVNALACISTGRLSLRGNLGILDNINRLLDRVSLYLA
jgi:hypothetical protein